MAAIASLKLAKACSSCRQILCEHKQNSAFRICGTSDQVTLISMSFIFVLVVVVVVDDDDDVFVVVVDAVVVYFARLTYLQNSSRR